jgi:hypothetical protein
VTSISHPFQHFKKLRELFHVDEDYSEATNLADKCPEKLKALIDAWFEEAEKTQKVKLGKLTLPGHHVQTAIERPRLGAGVIFL